MLVTDDDRAEILRIGEMRAPNEACGVLLTTPGLLKRVAEVPNRSTEPRDSTRMLDPDVRFALQELVGDPDQYQGDLERDLVVWHTHPGGKVGPGKVDMQYRKQLGRIRCLVVTLPTGEAVQF